MISLIIRPFLLFLFLIVTTAVAQGQLISDSLIASFDMDDIDSIFTSAGIFPGITPKDYEVDIYRLTYSTPSPQGGMTTATGALAVPKGKVCSPTMVYAHGTIANRYDVPSYLSDEAAIGVLGATGGYLVVEPDYLGLGDSPGFHPYVHAESEATATIDMMRAAREFCLNQNIGFSEQVFLSGYSQGGHAIMATHQMIHEQFSNEFSITASAPMAGPHDLSGVMKDLMTSNAAYSQPGYLPYLILGYQEAYGNLFTSVSDVFVAPYDAAITNFLNGQFDLSTVNGMLPSVPKDMLDTVWLNDFLNDSLHPMQVALRENDTYNWTPTDSMRLYHCSGDQVVPYSNSTIALNAFVANGSATVSQLDAGAMLNHGPCAGIALLAGKLWFDTLVKDSCLLASDPEYQEIGVRLEVFPNPASEKVMLKWQQVSSEASVSLLDMTGRVWYSQVLTGSSAELEIRELPTGIYLINFQNANQSTTKRLVVGR